MAFDRNLLPCPENYYRGVCGRLRGQGKWRTTCCSFCEFHTLRVNVETGAYVCTDCGASGNDVLTHHMELVGADEVQAAKGLGAWWYGRAAPATRLEVCHGF